MTAGATATPEEETVLPDPDERAEIIDFIEALRSRGHEAATAEPALVGPTGTRTVLPAPLYRVLVQAATALADGYAVTIAPRHQQLSTYQAAEFLGISRPTLIKLLDNGSIPHVKSSDRPGAHRRVRLGDLMIYKQRRGSKRHELLASLTRDAVEAGDYDLD